MVSRDPAPFTGAAHYPPTRRRPPTVYVARDVLAAIRETIGRLPAEHGGVLGGDRAVGVVTHFYFDHSGERTSGAYSPDDRRINALLREEWNPAGIQFMGFVHSHPPGFHRPTPGDEIYARRILDHMTDLEYLLLPIVLPEVGGVYELLPYVYLRDAADGHAQGTSFLPLEARTPVTGVQATTSKSAPSSAPLDVAVAGADGGALGRAAATATPYDLSATFRRVRDAYDLPRLARCRLVMVGVGGAVAFGEEMARAGVGEFVLIDPDIVSETNLATQQVYRRDLGRPKVECLAERIQDINPTAAVVPCRLGLDDLDDDAFAQLAQASLRASGELPVVTLLCGFTDDFFAQARVNRLALHLGLPSLAAQVYQEGRGAEIVYTYPGVTPACQRCVLSSRYRAFLDGHYHNQVTSDSTPIFATTRLNAIKGFVALALLHHGSVHPRWGGLLARMGNRNLVQVRLDPDFSANLGLRVFDRVLGGGDQSRLLFDETVWLPQVEESPAHGYAPCPDCGGSGDLRTAKGSFEDTRQMPPNLPSADPVVAAVTPASGAPSPTHRQVKPRRRPDRPQPKSPKRRKRHVPVHRKRR